MLVRLLKFNGFPRSSAVPPALKKLIREYDDTQLRALLYFMTGWKCLPWLLHAHPANKRIPHDVRLGVNNQLRSADDLPVAHTCLKAMDLFGEWSAELLRLKITRAIELTAQGGFGMM